MNFVSFNINGLRARPHQLEAVVEKYDPEIIALQETKVDDPQFPREAVEALGYHVTFFGQKGHYGGSHPQQSRADGGAVWLSQRRGRRSAALYRPKRALRLWKSMGPEWLFPPGGKPGPPQQVPSENGVLRRSPDLPREGSHAKRFGDGYGGYEHRPSDEDIGIGPENAKRWLRTGKTSFLPEERDWFERLLGWGLTDSYRARYPDTRESALSWFDYRSRGFEAAPKRGLRIRFS